MKYNSRIFRYEKYWLGRCLRLTPEIAFWTEYNRHTLLTGLSGTYAVTVITARHNASVGNMAAQGGSAT